MGRRRRNEDDWIWAVAQLAGLVAVLGFLSPQLRNAFSALFGIAVILLIAAVVLFIGWIIWKVVRARQQDPLSTDFGLNDSTHGGTLSVHTKPEPPSSEQLMEGLRSIDWFQFEKIVAIVYRKHGYMVTRRGGANADGGIDIVLEKNGGTKAVQCKQWKTWNVGVKSVREFLGALTDAGVKQGIFVTLCGYTGDAKQLAEKHGIQIINETDLARMMVEIGARFDPEIIDLMNDTRKFCPRCELEMVVRTAKKGDGAGQRFWGCSAYPRCRYTMPL